MNYKILTSVFRAGREYSTMADTIRSALHTGRYRPVTATGLSDGAADIFLPALVEDFREIPISTTSPPPTITSISVCGCCPPFSLMQIL